MESSGGGRFLGLEDQVKDTSRFFTNALIDDVNAFDAETIRRQAREFKLPAGSN